MRSDPILIVTCNRCRRVTEELELCAIARGGYDERYIDENLEQQGWKVDNGQDICPECQEDAPADSPSRGE